MASILHRSTRFLVVPCVLLAALASAQDSEFTGKVLGVIDGDTIDVMHEGKAERVRLYGVDTPEKNQAFGTKAKQFTSDQVFGKDVRVVVKDTDRYGRTIGDVFLPNGKRLSNELVSAGMAWWYKQYAPNDTKLMRRHLDASTKKVGLWADPLPVTPWDFRRGRGSAAGQAGSRQYNETDFDFLNRGAQSAAQPGERVLQPDALYDVNLTRQVFRILITKVRAGGSP